MKQAEAARGWARRCAALTGSLRRHGMFNWEEIREELGREECEDMQTQRESRVWLVDRADMGRGSRRTALDCAHVAGADLHGSPAEHHVLLGRPSDTTGQDYSVPSEATGRLARVETKDRSLVHYIGHKALKAAHAGLVGDIAMSFYSEIALNVEATIHGELERASESGLAEVVKMERRGSDMHMPPEDPLSADKIADAAAAVIRSNPDVPCPRGLFCMVSPEQAIQALDSGAGRRPRVYGIDAVISPAVKFDTDYRRYTAMVAPKRSVLVALSMIEIDARREGDGTVLTARYAAGASIDPTQTAKVVSWKR